MVKVGDTNYVLDGDGKIGGVELKTIQIEATYTTKTATNFVVLIKVRNEDGRSTTPLKRADGLTYEIAHARSTAASTARSMPPAA